MAGKKLSLQNELGSFRNDHTRDQSPSQSISLPTTKLECSVCLEEFSDSGQSIPRSLACGHSFCTGCVERLLDSSYNSSGIACPTCLSLTPLSTRSAELVPKNFGVLEILSTQPSTAPHIYRSPPKQSPYSREDNVFCTEHGDHLSSYCLTDKKLVCSSCLLYGTHKQHECLLVNEAASQRRSILNSVTPDVLAHKVALEAALLGVDRLNEQVQSTACRLSDIVDSKFDELVRCVEARRMKLRVKILERAQVRILALGNQSEKLKEFIGKAGVALDSCAALMSVSDLDVMRGFDLVEGKVEAAYVNPVSTVPIASDDLMCMFSQDVESEVLGLVERFGAISAEVGTAGNVVCQAYHDGFRISWEGHGFVDNEGISYHLQVAAGDKEYATIYRGGETKFTWKTEPKCDTIYKFRVQVRTTEGVGHWTVPVEAVRAHPAFRWHSQWRNLRIELSQDRLTAWWGRGTTQKYWATFACDRVLETDVHYMEIEVVDLGKSKSVKKLAVGVMDCSKQHLKSMDWQFGKDAIGTSADMPGWAFHPISGVLNCSVGASSLPSEGKPYSTILFQSGDRVGMLVEISAGKISFFCNGQDLGVAFEGVVSSSLLPAVSLRDKMEVRLCFPPPPYVKRTPKIIVHSSRTSSISRCDV